MHRAKTKILLAVCLAISAEPVALSHAAQFKRLYRFPPHRVEGVIQDPLAIGADGSIYGETSGGGMFNDGMIFKIAPNGQFTTLHSFGGTKSDGVIPEGGLVMDGAGNLYGTTSYGGGKNSQGTVFKLGLDGTETILYSFSLLVDDGASPDSGVTLDESGTLYGVTYEGGRQTHHKPAVGTIFQITKAGVETILHSFDSTDGAIPYGRLFRDKDGTLYGTTLQGGSDNVGTVFKYTVDGKFRVLHNFAARSTADGASPGGGLVLGRGGELYGTTFMGGSANKGTVYRITRGGSEELVLSFSGQSGENPGGDLIADAKGNLYGTAGLGGAPPSVGVVFELKSSSEEKVLHNFKGSDGSYPSGGLTFDTAGNLYGAATGIGPKRPYKPGSVFEITP